MAATDHLRIGFVTASGATSRHFEPFRALIPPEVEIDFQGLGLSRGYGYVGEDRLEATLRAAQAAAARGCHGIVVSGAPAEVANPTLPERLREAVRVPTTTALAACAAGLHALGASRVLLLTPFDAGMNDKIRDLLRNRRLEARLPATAFDQIEEAMQLTPDEVYRLATTACAVAGDVDAIYFQGAVLDPLAVMDRLEQDLGRPVVASNPSMLWFILSQLGRTYHIEGYGRLLREWPTPVAQRAE